MADQQPIDVTGLDPREEAIKRVVEGMAAGGKPVDAGQVRQVLTAIPANATPLSYVRMKDEATGQYYDIPQYYNEQVYAELITHASDPNVARAYVAAISVLHYENLVRNAQTLGSPMYSFASGEEAVNFVRQNQNDALASAERLGMVQPSAAAPAAPGTAPEAAPAEPPKEGLEGYIQRYETPMMISSLVGGVTGAIGFGLSRFPLGRTALGGIGHAGGGAISGYFTYELFHDVAAKIDIMRGNTDDVRREAWVQDWHNTAGKTLQQVDDLRRVMVAEVVAEAAMIPGMAHMAVDGAIGTVKSAYTVTTGTARGLASLAVGTANRIGTWRMGAEWYVETYRLGKNLEATGSAIAKPFVATAEAGARFVAPAAEAASKFVAPMVETTAPWIARATPWMARAAPWISNGLKFATGATLGSIATVGLGVAETGHGLMTRNPETTGRGTATLIGSGIGAALGCLGGPFAPLTVPAGIMLGGMAGSMLYSATPMLEGVDPDERSFLTPPLKAVSNVVRGGVNSISNTLMDVTDADPEKRRAGWRRTAEAAMIPWVPAPLLRRTAAIVVVAKTEEVTTAVTKAGAAAGRAVARTADDARDAAEDFTIGRTPWDKWGKELREDVANIQRNYSKYSKLDTDHDGKIELHELKNALKRKGVDEIKDADTNHDGKVSTQELMAKIASVGYANGPAVAPAAPAGAPRAAVAPRRG